MKQIKIKFSGMGEKFNSELDFIMEVLKQRYDVILSDKPDYLVYNVVSKDYLNYDCIRIFFTPENLVPDFNLCDYAIGFHYLNFGDRYFRHPLYLVNSFKVYEQDNYNLDLNRSLHKHEMADESFSEKDSFCSFVYSNSKAAYCRQAFFEALSAYKHVDSGGRYLNNIGGPVDNKLDFQRKHKFVIAFENTSTPGYTTEKIVHAFSAGAIPIYWGNPEIGREFNTKSFINCHEYGLTEKGEAEAISRIVKEVIRLDNDDAAYIQMLKEPAFALENDVQEHQEEFEAFLFNIFDQDKESAYRRNRLYWGKRYERKQKLGNKVYWGMRKIISLSRPIGDILRK